MLHIVFPEALGKELDCRHELSAMEEVFNLAPPKSPSPSFQLTRFRPLASVFEENDKLANICKWSCLLHSFLPIGWKIYYVFGNPSGALEVNKSFLHLVNQAKVAGKRCSNLLVDEHTRAESLLKAVLVSQSFACWLISACLTVLLRN